MSDASDGTTVLGSLCEIIMGQAPPGHTVTESEMGIPFLQGCAEFGSKYPQHKKCCSSPRKICNQDDILVSVRAPVGEINWADQSYCIGRGLVAIRFKEDFPRRYGWYLLEHARASLRKSAQGSTFEAVNRNDIETLIISILQPHERPKVVSILDSVDDAIRRTEAVIAKLQLVKAGMLHDLLTRGIDENGELRDPIRHPVHFNDSSLGKIPKEWKIKGLLEIASIVEGQVDPKLSPYADFILVAPDHIESATGRLLDSKTARQQGAISGKYLFSIGDVVYSKIRPYLRKVWLATFEGICSADMYPFRPNLEVDSQFLHMTLLSERFSIFAISVSERSGFPKINRKELSFFQLALPPRNEQERIVRAFKTVEERILKEQVAKDKILLLKQALMQDLLTRRVRVPEKLLEVML